MTEHVRAGTNAGHWVVGATVLGSGMVFLDATVVSVALPAIQRDLGTSLGGLQWTANASLVTLTALLLLGGSLGDRYGRRRIFTLGLATFTAASVLCGLAPSSGALIAARALQGIGGALLVPGSLAIISASFHPDDRGRAIGTWAGLTGVVSSIGPLLGGWLIDAVSWRAVFLVNVPLAAVAIWISLRHLPESSTGADHPLDLSGAALATLALGALSYAVVEPAGAWAIPAAVVGGGALVGFLVTERLVSHPMLPLSVFRSSQFSATNLTTLAVYAGMGGTFFLVVLRLQFSLDYNALEAGSALLPFTVLLLILSPRAGQVSQRLGARVPLTVGPLVAATGILLLSRLAPGDSFLRGVMPGISVLGLGMAITVAPLTAAVLASVDDRLAGTASGVNNAAARLAGLLAVAALPAMTGIAAEPSIEQGLQRGYTTALQVAATVTAAGGLAALCFVRRTASVPPTVPPSVFQPCQDPAALDTRAR